MEEDNGLSFYDVIKVILKKVWWVLGAIALGVLVAVLVTQLWYNKKTQYFSINYEIYYPDSASGKYPDGHEFLINETISLQALTEIKNGNDEFKSVNVEEMVQKDGVSASASFQKSADDSVKRVYSIKVLANYFSNKTQAVSFLRSIANYPIDRVNTVISDREYGVYLITYDNALTYEEKIDALTEQKNFLQSNYQFLMKYDINIETYYAKLINLFSDSQVKSLSDRIDSNHYVLNTKAYKDNSSYRIASLTKRIEDNEKTIKLLEEQKAKSSAADGGAEQASARAAVSEPNGVLNSYDYEIAKLVVANSEMQNELDTIKATLDIIEEYETEGAYAYKEKQSFDALLEEYRAELEKASEELGEVTKNLYTKKSFVVFGENTVKKQGGINAVVAALLGAVVGFVISAAVVCIIDLPKYKKNKLAAAQPQQPDEKSEKEEDAQE